MWRSGAAFSTSPRLRGEVGAKRRVRGPRRESELVEAGGGGGGGRPAPAAVAVAAYGLYQVAFELPEVRRIFLKDPAAAMARLGFLPGTPSEELLRHRVLDSKEPFATFVLTNSLAGFLVGPLALVLAVAVENLRRGGKGSRAYALGLAIIPGGLMLVCLLLTKSRSAWIGLFVAMLVITIRAGRGVSRRTLLLAGGGMAVVVIGAVLVLGSLRQLDLNILTESTKSLRFRWEYWRGTWAILTNAPNPYTPKGFAPMQGDAAPGVEVPIEWPEKRAYWLGLGPGNFAGAYLRHKLPEASEEVLDPHNMVLEVWTTAGLPAAVLLLVALGLGVWQTFRPSRQPEEPEPSTGKQAPDSPPASAAWLLVWSGMSWIGVVALGRLNPFEGDLLARWILLGLGWILAIATGVWLWRRRPIPAWGLGVAVLAVAVNLLAAGGIGVPGVALALWVLLAVGLNLRDDLPCGVLRERPGLVRPALAALGWAALFGAFWGAVGPFWRSEIELSRADALMRRKPPNFELARRDILAAMETDRANVRPYLDLAELEYQYWRSPDSRGRPSTWEKVFLALDGALLTPWRNPNSLMVRRMQVQYARMILDQIRNPTPRDLLSLRQKIVRGTRKATQLYPTSAILHAQLAQASAEIGMHGDAANEASVALELHELTPHADKKLPDGIARDLEEKLPGWIELRDHPPKIPTAEEVKKP
jgi:hypothetical protein